MGRTVRKKLWLPRQPMPKPTIAFKDRRTRVKHKRDLRREGGD